MGLLNTLQTCIFLAPRFPDVMSIIDKFEFLLVVTLFVAVVSGIVVMSESATGVVAALATQMLEEKPPSLEDFVPAGMPAADMPADTPAES